MPRRARLRPDDPIEAIGAHVSLRRLEPRQHLRFGGQRKESQLDIETRGGQHMVLGNHAAHTPRLDADRCRAFHHVGYAFETHPAAGIARQCKPVQPEIEVFLDRRRIKNRHAEMDQRMIALVRGGRGTGTVIVATQHQHAAVARAAGVIAVLQRIAGAIDTRALAIPQREHAVIRRFAEFPDLLRAPHRGCGQVLVDARHEADLVLVEEFLRLPQREIVDAERRAAITRDESRGVQPRRTIAPVLHQRQAHQRLRATQVDAPAGGGVLVIQADLCHRIGTSG